MFEKGFIKEESKILLDESSRNENLIDLSEEIERFSSFMDNIENSSMIGFIGRFGTGKSNFLNQIKNEYKENSKWFEFDAWMYPNRNDLWEGFILDIVRQSGGIKEEKKVNKQIKGKSTKGIWGDIITDITSDLSDKYDFNFLDKVTSIFKSEPITKTFEFQKILVELINKIEEENIYIIIEDIDRSGDNGIYFLETLNHFLKSSNIDKNLNKKIIIIIPIGEENYEKEELKYSYYKSIDYTLNYSLKEIKLNKFVEKLFIDDITKENHLKGQITSFLEGVFKEFPEQITMRILKRIIRGANSNYISLLKKQGEGIDWRLSILFETAKYIKVDINKKETYIKKWKSYKKISRSDSIFSALIECVFQNNHRVRGYNISDIYEEEYNGDNKIIKPRFFSYDIPIKLIDYKYSTNQAKDGVLYFIDRFREQNNYAGIINDYLN